MQTQWVVGGAPSVPVSLAAPLPPPSRARSRRGSISFSASRTSLPNGFDHVLFVIGIFLLTSRWRSIVAQVSTFTIAHSITLALTMYGIVSLPAKVVEPMIALSIAYVAIENLVVSELEAVAARAGVLASACCTAWASPACCAISACRGRRSSPRWSAFNVGVEAGQLSVIAAAFVLCAYWQHRDRSVSPLRRRAGLVRDCARGTVLDRSAGDGPADCPCNRKHRRDRSKPR